MADSDIIVSLHLDFPFISLFDNEQNHGVQDKSGGRIVTLYVSENSKFVNNSATIQARCKLSTDLENLDYKEIFDACWTKSTEVYNLYCL